MMKEMKQVESSRSMSLDFCHTSRQDELNTLRSQIFNPCKELQDGGKSSELNKSIHNKVNSLVNKLGSTSSRNKLQENETPIKKNVEVSHDVKVLKSEDSMSSNSSHSFPLKQSKIKFTRSKGSSHISPVSKSTINTNSNVPYSILKFPNKESGVKQNTVKPKTSVRLLLTDDSDSSSLKIKLSNLLQNKALSVVSSSISKDESMVVGYSEQEIAELMEKLIYQEMLDPSSELSWDDGSIPSVVALCGKKFSIEYSMSNTADSGGTFTIGTVSDTQDEEEEEEEAEEEIMDEMKQENLLGEEEKEKIYWETMNAFNWCSMPNGWELIKCSPSIWDSSARPGNGILHYCKLNLVRDEENGFLSDRIIATGQSCLGRCPDSQGYVYTKLVLSRMVTHGRPDAPSLTQAFARLVQATGSGNS